MIRIQQSSTADTRTCDFANVSKDTLGASSAQHIGDVRVALGFLRPASPPHRRRARYRQAHGSRRVPRGFRDRLHGVELVGAAPMELHLNNVYRDTPPTTGILDAIDAINRVATLVSRFASLPEPSNG